MQSITIDILNVNALKLLQDLELLKLIRVRKGPVQEKSSVNWAAKYKGAMTKQPLTETEIDKQLNDLRNK